MTTNPLPEWHNSLEAWDGMSAAWKKVPVLAEGPKEMPPYNLRYRAFELVKPEDVKVVILGQDPYSTRGHANGLAFSVNAHITKLPPSLQNIFAEYVRDTGFAYPRSGDLSAWAEHGVLLLNTALTTVEGVRGAHLNDWKEFTKSVIRWLSRLSGDRVFILWGRHAGEYENCITRGHILKSTHPSPLSASRADRDIPPFIGSKPFTMACDILGIDKEIWRL